MDYEQKYKEALERARALNDGKDVDVEAGTTTCEYIFPELKESEDERMIKSLKRLIKAYYDVNFPTPEGFEREDMLAWLEKQGKQKSIDNLTPQEAMDIAVAKCFEQGEQKPVLDIEIPFGAKDSELKEATYLIPEGFHAEIEGDKVVIKKGEQKSAWSEEDEKMFRSLHNLIYVVRDCDCDSSKKKEFSDFLVSLKNRVQPQSKQEWNEEDEKCIRLSTDIIDSALRAGFCVQLDRDRCVDWFKSLKQRMGWKPSDEQMHYLSWIANVKLGDSVVEQEVSKHLNELYKDLKKLREE